MSKNPNALLNGKKSTLCARVAPLRAPLPAFAVAKLAKKTEKHLINLAQYQAIMLKPTHYFDQNDTILTQ